MSGRDGLIPGIQADPGTVDYSAGATMSLLKRLESVLGRTMSHLRSSGLASSSA